MKDIIALVGLGLLTFGCGMVSTPLSFIASGVTLILWAVIEEVRR